MMNPVPFFSLHWQNYFDIFIVATLIYSLYIWLKGTRAFQILVGLVGLGMLYFAARWSGLFLTSWLLQYLLGVILLLAIVIFQPEIRQLLERVSPLAFLRQKGLTIPRSVLNEIAATCFHLAAHRIGALFIFPRAAPLIDLVQEGIRLDSLVSQSLLVTLFQKNSAMHDGAVIIENGRVTKAGCYLPLSTREGLPSQYGTRHRAALGISEHGDAVGIVVSEERGIVSFVQGGAIHPMTGEDQLRQRLEEELLPQYRVKTTFREMLIAFVTSRLSYQEMIRQNMAAKFVALGLSLLLWFMLVGQEWSETFTSAKVEYQNIPIGLDIISEPVTDIHVRVRGPRGSIATLGPNQARVMVDLSHVTPGTNVVQLSDQNLELPFGLEATSIEPAALPMQFDRIVTKQFKVDQEFTGKLPAGLRLAQVIVRPNPVELRGPERDLDKIVRVTTGPINLSEITTSQTLRRQVRITASLASAKRITPTDVTVSLNLISSKLKDSSLGKPLSLEESPLALTRLPATLLKKMWKSSTPPSETP